MPLAYCLSSSLSLTVIKIMHFQEKQGSAIVLTDRESKQRERGTNCLPEITKQQQRIKLKSPHSL